MRHGMISFARRALLPLAIAILATAWPATLPAGGADESPWEAIADDATIVVRIAHPQKALQEWVAFCERAKTGWGDEFLSAVSVFGEMVSAPEFEGLDRDSSWWAALYPEADQSEPGYALILPVTDRKKLPDWLKKGLRPVDGGPYAVYTSDSVAAGKTTARLQGENKSIAGVIDVESRKLFDRGRLSLFINAVAPIAATKIGEMKQELESSDNRRAGGLLEMPGVGDPSAAPLIRMIEDVRSVTLTADVAKDGISLEGLVRFRSETPTALGLPKSSPDALPDMAALPAGGNIYFGAAGEWLDFLRSINPAWDGEPDRLRDPKPELDAAEAELRKLRIDALVGSIRMPDNDGSFCEATILRLDNAEAFRNLTRRIARLKDGADTATFRWSAEVRVDDERFGGDPADVTEWRRAFRKPDDAGMLSQKWTTRTLSLDGRIVETSGTGRETLQNLRAAVTSRQRPVPNLLLGSTRSRLDAEADLVLLIDAPAVCWKVGHALSKAVAKAFRERFLFGLLAGALPEEKDGDPFGELPLPDSFSGLSAVGLPDGIRFRGFIPLEQVQGFGQIQAAIEDQMDEAEEQAKEEHSWLTPQYFDQTVFGAEGPQAVAAKHRLLERRLRREIATLDWPCQLTDAQKKKLELAGHGDIQHVFDAVEDQRQDFEHELAERSGDDFQRIFEIVGSAERLLEANPFDAQSTFGRVLSKSLSAEQLARREALFELRRLGGALKKERRGTEELNAIELKVTKFGDEGLPLLARFGNVQVLNLDTTRVTDAGLAQLEPLAELVSLDLGSTAIGDAGLAHVRKLSQLRFLDLRSTPVGDEGLAHLAGLSSLKHLGLFGTRTTDAGLAHLRELKGLEVLLLGSTAVSDAGLAHLEGLTHLKELSLLDTKIGDSGLAHLAGLTNLEKLDLRNTRVTAASLEHLGRLTNLKELYLFGTELSDSGAAMLKQTLRKARIYR